MPEVYILIIPGFGVISTTISASSNKSVFGTLGMVKVRPTFTNNDVNLLYMLETSKTLNTSSAAFYSHNFKGITMRNQQVTKLFNIFWVLRDYTRRIILQGWLRYSPVFWNNVKKFFNTSTFLSGLLIFFSALAEQKKITEKNNLSSDREKLYFRKKVTPSFGLSLRRNKKKIGHKGTRFSRPGYDKQKASPP